MQTMEALRRRIKSAEDLLAVVRTMKALAAVNIRHYEKAVAALADYDHTIELGLHVLVRERPPRLAPRAVDEGVALVVFGTDQGLCGQFNERVVACAHDTLTRAAHRSTAFAPYLLTMGERCAGLLTEAGHPPDQVVGVPSGIAGITPLVGELLLYVDHYVDRWQARRSELGSGAGGDRSPHGPSARVLLIHNRPVGTALYRPEMTTLLPLDTVRLRQLAAAPWQSRALPFHRQEWHQLFSALVQHHLFVALYRACVESLASEDASRLMAMQNAESNIQDRLDGLSAAYHHQRQTRINAELLDIVAGFEAVAGHASD